MWRDSKYSTDGGGRDSRARPRTGDSSLGGGRKTKVLPAHRASGTAVIVLSPFLLMFCPLFFLFGGLSLVAWATGGHTYQRRGKRKRTAAFWDAPVMQGFSFVWLFGCLAVWLFVFGGPIYIFLEPVFVCSHTSPCLPLLPFRASPAHPCLLRAVCGGLSAPSGQLRSVGGAIRNHWETIPHPAVNFSARGCDRGWSGKREKRAGPKSCGNDALLLLPCYQLTLGNGGVLKRRSCGWASPRRARVERMRRGREGKRHLRAQGPRQEAEKNPPEYWGSRGIQKEDSKKMRARRATRMQGTSTSSKAA